MNEELLRLLMGLLGSDVSRNTARVYNPENDRSAHARSVASGEGAEIAGSIPIPFDQMLDTYDEITLDGDFPASKFAYWIDENRLPLREGADRTNPDDFYSVPPEHRAGLARELERGAEARRGLDAFDRGVDYAPHSLGMDEDTYQRMREVAYARQGVVPGIDTMDMRRLQQFQEAQYRQSGARPSVDMFDPAGVIGTTRDDPMKLLALLLR